MIFTTLDFFYFFIVAITVFYSLPDRHRNTWILATSYFFYGYWSVKFLCLLVFTIIFDYVMALLIHGSRGDRQRKLYLWSSISVNLGVLFLFKYFGLFEDTVAYFTGKRPFDLEVILPFGISFYTFHAMSYTIDVYRRVIPAERNFTWYSCYVMFFPQLVAGPIARASHLLHQFAKPKRLRVENIITGSYWVAKGYLFKIVFADSFGGFVDAYFGAETGKTPLLVLQSVYFFAFQIYLDFFGYTLIARGLAKWMDYDLVENFRTPYFATSITDFWRRWHISLSTWLRDYLYISLGGNRLGKLLTYRNLMITMLLGGLWHGSNFTFVVWGALHGAYLCFEKLTAGSRFTAAWTKKVPVPLQMCVTFHAVCLAWIFFRSENFTQAYQVVEYCLTFFASPIEHFQLGQVHIKLWCMLLFIISFDWAELRFSLEKRYYSAQWVLRFATVYGMAAVTALFTELNPKAFIYFQF